ncbi:hypothetical protein Tco_1476190 [Tanacetum coccineum]
MSTPSGGLWVMIELNSSKSKLKFMEHVGVASWFRSLCNAQSDFAAKEGLIALDVASVSSYSRSTGRNHYHQSLLHGSHKGGSLLEVLDGMIKLYVLIDHSDGITLEPILLREWMSWNSFGLLEDSIGDGPISEKKERCQMLEKKMSNMGWLPSLTNTCREG